MGANTAPRPRRIVLVTPKFHAYWRAAALALRERGHDVLVHAYDALPGLAGKARNKLLHDLPEPLRPAAWAQQLTDRAARAVRDGRPDVVVTIRGDQLGEAYWHEVLRRPHVTWVYDELVRMQYTVEQLCDMGPIASYSRFDVERLRADGVDIHFLPNSFDARAPIVTRVEPNIVFVGARYAEREALFDRLRDRGLSMRVYGREWSRHPWDVLRTRRWRSSGFDAGRDLTRSEAYGAMAAAPATVNVHIRGTQDGLNMRSFEACGVGAVQLLDRADAAEFYEPGREVLLFEDDDELVDLAARAVRDRAWADGIRSAARARTLAEHTFDHRMATLEELWG